MRILITGANGFLGQKLAQRLASSAAHSVLLTSASAYQAAPPLSYPFVQADLTKASEVETLVRTYQPTHIIHTAAISSVDVCEKDRALCEQINTTAVAQLAALANELDAHLTFLSTDFVFDGKHGPYRETDAVAACNAYGSSKIAAEQALSASGCRHAILRTILVYGTPNQGSSGKNLVSWAREALSQGQAIRVVNDQWRMPTWVEDLVTACLLAAEKEATGIFHISGAHMMSVLEVVQEVARFWQLDSSLITPISAMEIGQDKNRPRQTGFILDKAKTQLGYTPTPFAESLNYMDKDLDKA